MKQRKKIGFLGLGNMGLPMALNLQKAGCDLTVYDLREAPVSTAAAAGAAVAESAEALARQSDILFTSLPQPPDVERALPPLLQVMSAGSAWVDLTTNERDLVLHLAAQAAARGVEVVEAPLTGAVDGARQARLTFFVAGEAGAIGKVRAYLELMGRPLLCGELGCGNVTKLITNQMWFINAAAIGEALALGKKAGVELPVVWEALKNSVGDSFVTRHDVPVHFCRTLRSLLLAGPVLQRPAPAGKTRQRDRHAAALHHTGAGKV